MAETWAENLYEENQQLKHQLKGLATTAKKNEKIAGEYYEELVEKKMPNARSSRKINSDTNWKGWQPQQKRMVMTDGSYSPKKLGIIYGRHF